MSLGGKQKSTTTTQVTTPWADQQPYLRNLFSRAESLYNQQGTPSMGLLNSAQDQAAKTIRGDFLDPTSNPHFSGALSNTLNQVRSRINSQFGGDNYGNSAHQEWLNRGMTEAAAGLLADQFNRERSNQMSTIAQAPGLTAAGANLPWMPLQNFQQAVSGNYGGTSTAQQPYFTNSAATGLGLGLGALGLFGTGGMGGLGLLGGLF